MPGFGETSSEGFAERYAAAMARAEDTYRDVLDALNAAEIPAFITQTGGMCLAIQIPWGPPKPPHNEPDWFWLCDRDDSLSWDRDESQGWGLGFYLSENDDYGVNEDWEILERELKTPESAVDLVMEGIRNVQARHGEEQ